jgi:hypothetical protein
MTTETDNEQGFDTISLERLYWYAADDPQARDTYNKIRGLVLGRGTRDGDARKGLYLFELTAPCRVKTPEGDTREAQTGERVIVDERAQLSALKRLAESKQLHEVIITPQRQVPQRNSPDRTVWIFELKMRRTNKAKALDPELVAAMVSQGTSGVEDDIPF